LLKRAILESSLDSIITINHETEIIEFNPSAEKTFGCIRDEAIGKQATDLIISINNGEVYGQGFVRYLLSDSGEAVNKLHEGIGKRADGSEFPIELSITRLQLERPIVTAYIRDITERKQMEKAEQELAQMKDDFIANVSHQLRTPIFSIRGFLDLLLKGKVKEETVQQEFLSRAYEESDKLMLLVDNLLDMSQLESGLLHLEMKELVLNSLIDEVLKSLQQLADDKEISLTHTSSESQVRINGDPRWLSEALVNLVGNAIKFSQPGLPIRVIEQVRDGRVLVKVIDQGPGIPDEALPKLFGKFYQVEGQTNRTGSSSGMGLYIAKGIVEEHGGRIGVKSKLGQGSVFYFTLPLLGQKVKGLLE
jgi:PAS domain S-box-containing protein